MNIFVHLDRHRWITNIESTCSHSYSARMGYLSVQTTIFRWLLSGKKIPVPGFFEVGWGVGGGVSGFLLNKTSEPGILLNNVVCMAIRLIELYFALLLCKTTVSTQFIMRRIDTSRQ